eukprot:Gb_23688 [translate_table: standard]
MSKERGRVEGLDSVNRKLKRVENQRGRRSMMGVQTSPNTSTPCAACKLLRRRCAQECPFSPYFSPHEPQKFACVHKIFGASNVSKMLMEVPESQRADAANSLVYEANARIRDPVYGCMGVISALQQQAQTLQAELNAVRGEIIRYRCHENAVAAAMAVGYTTLASDRAASSAISSQTSDSADFTVVSPSTTVTTTDTKEPCLS